MNMTVANWITVARILLIPVFVTSAVYYGTSLQEGAPQEWYRLVAIFAFIFAAVSDALDGFVARKFKQFSALGRILDPIADKGLLLAAVVTLSFSKWHYQLPLWFVILVVSRDLVIILGFAVLHYLAGRFEVHPRFLGKACTASQMISVTLVLLQTPHAPELIYDIPVYIAAVLTVLSGLDYIRDGIRRLNTHGLASSEERR